MQFTYLGDHSAMGRYDPLCDKHLTKHFSKPAMARQIKNTAVLEAFQRAPAPYRAIVESYLSHGPLDGIERSSSSSYRNTAEGATVESERDGTHEDRLNFGGTSTTPRNRRLTAHSARTAAEFISNQKTAVERVLGRGVESNPERGHDEGQMVREGHEVAAEARCFIPSRPTSAPTSRKVRLSMGTGVIAADTSISTRGSRPQSARTQSFSLSKGATAADSRRSRRLEDHTAMTRPTSLRPPSAIPTPTPSSSSAIDTGERCVCGAKGSSTCIHCFFRKRRLAILKGERSRNRTVEEGEAHIAECGDGNTAGRVQRTADNSADRCGCGCSCSCVCHPHNSANDRDRHTEKRPISKSSAKGLLLQRQQPFFTTHYNDNGSLKPTSIPLHVSHLHHDQSSESGQLLPKVEGEEQRQAKPLHPSDDSHSHRRPLSLRAGSRNKRGNKNGIGGAHPAKRLVGEDEQGRACQPPPSPVPVLDLTTDEEDSVASVGGRGHDLIQEDEGNDEKRRWALEDAEVGIVNDDNESNNNGSGEEFESNRAQLSTRPQSARAKPKLNCRREGSDLKKKGVPIEIGGSNELEHWHTVPVATPRPEHREQVPQCAPNDAEGEKKESSDKGSRRIRSKKSPRRSKRNGSPFLVASPLREPSPSASHYSPHRRSKTRSPPPRTLSRSPSGSPRANKPPTSLTTRSSSSPEVTRYRGKTDRGKGEEKIMASVESGVSTSTDDQRLKMAIRKALSWAERHMQEPSASTGATCASSGDKDQLLDENADTDRVSNSTSILAAFATAMLQRVGRGFAERKNTIGGKKADIEKGNEKSVSTPSLLVSLQGISENLRVLSSTPSTQHGDRHFRLDNNNNYYTKGNSRKTLKVAAHSRQTAVVALPPAASLLGVLTAVGDDRDVRFTAAVLQLFLSETAARAEVEHLWSATRKTIKLVGLRWVGGVHGKERFRRKSITHTDAKKNSNTIADRETDLNQVVRRVGSRSSITMNTVHPRRDRSDRDRSRNVSAEEKGKEELSSQGGGDLKTGIEDRNTGKNDSHGRSNAEAECISPFFKRKSIECSIRSISAVTEIEKVGTREATHRVGRESGGNAKHGNDDYGYMDGREDYDEDDEITRTSACSGVARNRARDADGLVYNVLENAILQKRQETRSEEVGADTAADRAGTGGGGRTRQTSLSTSFVSSSLLLPLSLSRSASLRERPQHQIEKAQQGSRRSSVSNTDTNWNPPAQANCEPTSQPLSHRTPPQPQRQTEVSREDHRNVVEPEDEYEEETVVVDGRIVVRRQPLNSQSLPITNADKREAHAREDMAAAVSTTPTGTGPSSTTITTARTATAKGRALRPHHQRGGMEEKSVSDTAASSSATPTANEEEESPLTVEALGISGSSGVGMVDAVHEQHHTVLESPPYSTCAAPQGEAEGSFIDLPSERMGHERNVAKHAEKLEDEVPPTRKKSVRFSPTVAGEVRHPPVATHEPPLTLSNEHTVPVRIPMPPSTAAINAEGKRRARRPQFISSSQRNEEKQYEGEQQRERESINCLNEEIEENTTEEGEDESHYRGEEGEEEEDQFILADAPPPPTHFVIGPFGNVIFDRDFTQDLSQKEVGDRVVSNESSGEQQNVDEMVPSPSAGSIISPQDDVAAHDDATEPARKGEESETDGNSLPLGPASVASSGSSFTVLPQRRTSEIARAVTASVARRMQ